MKCDECSEPTKNLYRLIVKGVVRWLCFDCHEVQGN